VNWPTQSFASYVTGCALNDLIRKIVDHYMGGDYGAYALYCIASRVFQPAGKLPYVPVVIGEVHDSLAVDSPASEEHMVSRFIREAMTEAVSLRRLAPDVPNGLLDVDIVTDSYWTKG